MREDNRILDCVLVLIAVLAGQHIDLSLINTELAYINLQCKFKYQEMHLPP